MQSVNGRPLATFCGSFLIGSAAGITFRPATTALVYISLASIAALFRHFRLWHTSIAGVAVLAIGLGAMHGLRYRQQEIWLSRFLPLNERAVVIGRVQTNPSLKFARWRFIFRAESLLTSHGAIRTPTHIWVSVSEAEVGPLLYGERLRLEGVLKKLEEGKRVSTSGFARYLAQQGVVRTLYPYRVHKLPSQSWLITFARLRETLLRNLRSHLPGREGDIVAAIVLNDRTGLDNAIRESFRRTGTIHILSPSGTHVTILAMAIWAICRWAKLSRKTAALAVILIIWIFAAVAAGDEPTFRAAVMGTLVAGAVALQREVDPPTSLSLAGFLLVWMDAATLRDPGFQFSFTLVAAIIAAAGWLQSLVASGGGQRTVRGMVIAAFMLSVVCAIASAPLTALYYGQMSLIAPIANLLIALPLQVVMCGGFLFAVLPPLPELLSTPVAVSAWLVERLVHLLAQIPWSSAEVPPPSPSLIVGFYTLFFALLFYLSARAARRREALT